MNISDIRNIGPCEWIIADSWRLNLYRPRTPIESATILWVVRRMYDGCTGWTYIYGFAERWWWKR